MQRELQLREDVGRRSFPGQIFTQISAVLAVEIHIGDGHATTVVVAVAVEKRHAVEPQVPGVENPSRRTFPLLLRCRSEERRVGKEGVGTFRSRWSPYP